MRQLVNSGISIALGLGIAGVVQAQQSPVDRAIKLRQSVMTLQGATLGGALGPMVQGRVPYDKAVFAENAHFLEMLAKRPWQAFSVAGSDQGNTRMKPEALKDVAKFKEFSDKLQMETTALAKAADGGNIDEIKRQFGVVGQTCKQCHDAFQKP